MVTILAGSIPIDKKNWICSLREDFFFSRPIRTKWGIFVENFSYIIPAKHDLIIIFRVKDFNKLAIH